MKIKELFMPRKKKEEVAEKVATVKKTKVVEEVTEVPSGAAVVEVNLGVDPNDPRNK